jgi:hypothetical protein
VSRVKEQLTRAWIKSARCARAVTLGDCQAVARRFEGYLRADKSVVTLKVSGGTETAMSGDDTGLPLADVIEELRRELVEAASRGEGQPVRFRLLPVEIELQVVVSREVGAKGGVKFWVVNAGGKLATSNTLTHTLKVSLEPHSQAGGELLVSGLGTRG